MSVLSFLGCPRRRLTASTSSYAKLIKTFLRPLSPPRRISFARSSRWRVSPNELPLLPPPPPICYLLRNRILGRKYNARTALVRPCDKNRSRLFPSCELD